MTTVSNLRLNQIGAAHMTLLTATTSETLAYHLVEKRNRIFSAAEMWNIQRRKKMVTRRRITL